MDELQSLIREIPDFPKAGISYKDITPLLGSAGALRRAIEALSEKYAGLGVDRVASTESRGFIFGAPLAVAIGAGFVPIRKPGKLPYQTDSVSYSLEYGEGSLEVHTDAFAPKERVLFVDDVLATGGTARASCQLIEKQGAEVVGLAFLAELSFLNGRDCLKGWEVYSLIRY